MRYQEFSPLEGHVKHLNKPWDPQLIKGVIDCLARNLNAPKEEIAQEVYGDIYVILAKDGELIEDQYQASDVKGAYILRRQNMYFDRRDQALRDKWRGQGVQGVALALDPEYRGTGVGKQLINIPYALGYDYIWGMHLERLQNLDHWLKRRELVTTLGKPPNRTYVTAVRLKKQ